MYLHTYLGKVLLGMEWFMEGYLPCKIHQDSKNTDYRLRITPVLGSRESKKKANGLVLLTVRVFRMHYLSVSLSIRSSLCYMYVVSYRLTLQYACVHQSVSPKASSFMLL